MIAEKSNIFITNGQRIIKLGLMLKNTTAGRPKPGCHWVGNTGFPDAVIGSFDRKHRIYSGWLESPGDGMDGPWVEIPREYINHQIILQLEP